MIGKRKQQSALFDVGNVFDLELDPHSFHAQLAVAGPALFPDDAFQDLYSAETGRPSIPPAQMALLVLLQYHAGVSDQEAVERSAYDLRWAAVLRRTAGTPLCARTTLVLFRARLALHDASDRLFDCALQHAREHGLLKAGALRVILDTKAVIGRGAVEDTYNLLARSMDRLIRALAAAVGQPVADWAAAHALTAYVREREQSLKGGAEVDWSQASARRRFLTQIVRAARRLLALATDLLPQLDAQQPEAARAVRTESELLRGVLAQDVVETPPSSEGPSTGPSPGTSPGASPGTSPGSGESGTPETSATAPAATASAASLRDGTAKDRVPSATDPEQRHGHKSASQKFTGHKARIAVEPESQLIVDVDVLAGNAGDGAGALAQVEAVEQRTGQPVAETVGDCAFGSGAIRQEFADAERTLRARVPGTPERWDIPKSRFRPTWDGPQVVALTCIQGVTTTDFREQRGGGRLFTFGAECARCPLRHKCVQSPKAGASRTVQIHPQEHLLQTAREYQSTPEGRETFQQRVVVEHALARLSGLGIGRARYFGRQKTRAQLLFAATVANLRWLWNWQARKGEGPTADLLAALLRGLQRLRKPPRSASERTGPGSSHLAATPGWSAWSWPSSWKGTSEAAFCQRF